MSETPKTCKDCAAEGISTRRPAPNPGPRCATHWRAERARRKKADHDRRVQAVYGVAPGDYDRLYEAQGGTCAGCRRATGKAKKLAVDHDHQTSEVRGLLCGPCNQLIGRYGDDPETLFRLGLYLVNPPARFVLTDSHTCL